MDAFIVVARPELAGSSIELEWEATSTSADGVASGSLRLTVADEPLTLEELLADSDEVGARDD